MLKKGGKSWPNQIKAWNIEIGVRKCEKIDSNQWYINYCLLNIVYMHKEWSYLTIIWTDV